MGEIIVVSDESVAADAVKELEKAEIIGFDTETKPAFRKGQQNTVALLQLAMHGKCYLFRLCRIGMLPEVKRLLEDRHILKVGLSIKDDFHSLNKLGELSPDGFVDLQEYVKEFGISDCSLTKINSIVTGKRISKSQQLSNWEAKELSNKQKEYAALDAMACINIFEFLRDGKFNPEDSPYIHFPEEE